MAAAVGQRLTTMGESLPYRLLIFDWDGTLEDSVTAISRSIQRTLTAAGLPQRPLFVIRDVIGLHFEEGLAQLYPDRNSAELARMCREQSAALPVVDDMALFEQATEVLEQLHAEGYWLAIATGKSRQGLDHALRRYQLDEQFLVTRTADDARSKPDPEMLFSILDYTGVSAADALMVGDSTHDVAMAQAANIDCVAVSSGVHSVATLQSIDYALSCLESVRDLLPWLLQRNKRARY
ncbi:MAG: HAD-IA family hydrolase [Gammaproteobacteria bacterium]|nr:HAD-IA family hydrolase [Gammaproteobacteria bacterium]